MVWAASFFGGWIGAAIAESQGPGDAGPVGLVLGGVLGGGSSLILWLLAIRRLRPSPSAVPPDRTPEL